MTDVPAKHPDTGRALIHFPKPKTCSRSNSELVGVRVRKKTEKRTMLWTGVGRSGTTWMYRMLNHLGWSVGHEVVEVDGCVSWYLHTDANWYPWHPWDKRGTIHFGERASDYEFEHTFHLVRHPLKTIASLKKVILSTDFEWCRQYGFIPDAVMGDKLLMSMHLWHNINRHCEHLVPKTHRFRLEELNIGDRTAWKRFFTIMGEDVDDALKDFKMLPPKNRGTGYRKPTPVRWRDLHSADSDLTNEILSMIYRYGYDK